MPPPLKHAAQPLSFSGSAEAMPLLLVLTDGEQTVLGGDEEAVYAATAVKSGGASLVALSLGVADAETMERMASAPSATYARRAETVDVLLAQVASLVAAFCTDAVYGCRLSTDCRADPLEIAVHGSGFIERGTVEGGGGGLPDLLSCRVRAFYLDNGVVRVTSETVVAPTFVDNGTLTCSTPGVDVADRAPSASFTVEVTIDGGAYWTKVDELAYTPLPPPPHPLTSSSTSP